MCALRVFKHHADKRLFYILLFTLRVLLFLCPGRRFFLRTLGHGRLAADGLICKAGFFRDAPQIAFLFNRARIFNQGRRLTGEGAVKRHIMDMGITKGTEVFVRKVAPLGDPIEVTVRGYELSLRKSEAGNILVA